MELSKNSQLALREIQALNKKNGRVVFISGSFNILHSGHLRLLRFASECGDFLVVGILDDKISPNAILKQEDRLEVVQAIELVNYAFVLPDSPLAFIADLQPQFVVKGQEHELTSDEDKAVLGLFGGKLLFNSGGSTLSSLDLLSRDSKPALPTILQANDYLRRHKGRGKK